MNHKQLVEIAKFWLKSAKNCNPVFIEKGTARSNEIPDVIGWDSLDSYVVECKTSLEDFRKDALKPFRKKPEEGMGKYRYYLLDFGLYAEIGEANIPKGWGIVLVNPDLQSARQARLKYSKLWPHNIEAELYYLRNRILEIQRYGR